MFGKEGAHKARATDDDEIDRYGTIAETPTPLNRRRLQAAGDPACCDLGGIPTIGFAALKVRTRNCSLPLHGNAAGRTFRGW